MGGVYTSWEALRAAIIKEMSAAMDEALERAYHDLQQNVMSFYAGGEPLIYIRTLKLAAAPRVKGPNGGGSQITGDVYMDQNYEYNTGTWSTGQIMDAAESGNANLVGTPGWWRRTESDIDEIIVSAFGSKFG